MRLWVEICSLGESFWGFTDVSLFVRLWVEINPFYEKESRESRQPLREAVSWNGWNAFTTSMGIASASSWGCELKCRSYRGVKRPRRQPLREAVSWNVYLIIIVHCSDSSASSWGCELKYYENYTGSIAGAVSLFVRLWVEILRQMWWSWTMIVSLFVRLWVEIIQENKNYRELTVSLFVRLWVEMLEIQ